MRDGASNTQAIRLALSLIACPGLSTSPRVKQDRQDKVWSGFELTTLWSVANDFPVRTQEHEHGMRIRPKETDRYPQPDAGKTNFRDITACRVQSAKYRVQNTGYGIRCTLFQEDVTP